MPLVPQVSGVCMGISGALGVLVSEGAPGVGV